MLRQFLNPAEVDTAIARSAEGPVIIYKHSLTCGVSAMAHEQLLEATATPGFDADVYLVPVQTQPDVSRAVAARLGVRHESPQIFVLRDGVVVWQASHFRISADEIAAAVQSRRPATHA